MLLNSRSLWDIPLKKPKGATVFQLLMMVSRRCFGDSNPFKCCGGFEPETGQCELLRGEALSALTSLKTATKSERM